MTAIILQQMRGGWCIVLLLDFPISVRLSPGREMTLIAHLNDVINFNLLEQETCQVKLQNKE